MAETRHTPGPWKVTKSGGLMSTAPHITRDVWLLPMCEADLTLMAAAPELLEALVSVGVMHEGETELCWCGMPTGRHSGYCQKARAAVAKAEGTGHG